MNELNFLSIDQLKDAANGAKYQPIIEMQRVKCGNEWRRVGAQ